MYKTCTWSWGEGSKKAVLVVRNNMAYSQTLLEEIPSGQGSCGTTAAQTTHMRVQLQEGVMGPRVPIHPD